MERQVEKAMDPVQMTRLLLWLDDEHRKDKAEIQFLREKLATQSPVNENYAAQIRELTAQVSLLKTQNGRMTPLEEELNQAKSQIGQLRELVERYRDATERSESVRETEIEHLLKSRASLEQCVEELSREVSAPLPKIQALGEDFKRVMAIFPQFEAVRQQTASLAVRLPGFETEDRRSSERLAAIEKALEDVKNNQVRIQEVHRLGTEEQRHSTEQATAQARALQRRFDERTAALQLLVAEASKGQESLVTVQAQIDAAKQEFRGLDARIARVEEQIPPLETLIGRAQEGSTGLRQEVTRLTHLQAAGEQRIATELPVLRKAAADQETRSRELAGQLAELILQIQRERESVVEVRRLTAALVERHDQAVSTLIEFQEQTLREQANALSMRIQDSQRLPRPSPRHGHE